jgi:hypothetical protein
MKKTLSVVLTAVLLCMSVFCVGCVSKQARQQANAYTKQYKKDFKTAVQTRMGSDYSLSNVSGKLEAYGSVMTIGYDAARALTGTVKNKKTHKKYNATYDFDKDILYTNAFNDEIFDDLIDTLKIDKSQIITRASVETLNERYEYPSYVRRIEDALGEKRAIEYFIVTSENLDNYDFTEYRDLCKNKKFCCCVHILSADNFSDSDIETFKQDFHDIIPDATNVTLDYHGRDIFSVFPLKKYVFIARNEKGVPYYRRYNRNGLEYTSK